MYFDVTNERSANHRHRGREGENQNTTGLYLYIMEIHNVCLCVFVQLKWICRGIKCHKIRIKGDNAICSSYRLLSWEHTCIHSSHSQWNTDCAYARIACLLFVQSFPPFIHSFIRWLVGWLVPSIVHSFAYQKNKQIFQLYGTICYPHSAATRCTVVSVNANVRTSKCKYV